MAGLNKQPKCEPSSPHGWTLDTLEEYLTSKVSALEKYFTDLTAEREARNSERFSSSEKAVTTAFAAAKEAVTAAMAASEKAVQKAEMAADKRSDASNEIRAAMIDQQKTLASKAETDFRFESAQKRLDLIERALAASGGKAQGLGAAWGYLVGAVGVAVGLSLIAGKFIH